MKTRIPVLAFCLLHVACSLPAQTNILVTNPAAEQVMAGNYDPAQYAPPFAVTDPAAIAEGLENLISPDSLKSYIIRLSEFETRNSGSDTVSATTGIGAARRWIYEKFRSFSVENNDRLLASYLQFDLDICGMARHRNVFAVLPGSDTANHGLVLIEGHFDSRCDVLCDVTCLAEGVEDNATGTALVMELARVMGKFSFPQTLVFVATTAEEQGLLGAEAFARYMDDQNLPLRAVLNNDVIGGVICGQTSSPPSCPGLNHIDSTSVRLFSSGSFNSKHKQLARYVKLEYGENLMAGAAVPMNVRIMSPEDRTGRGGDHIPFREHNFPAIRFTAANEHGDASNGPGYTDRQHTSDDVLGADTDGDGVVDSFFVQFNYLARNALINGNAAAMIVQGVPAPTNFTATRTTTQLSVAIVDPAATGLYRVALRTSGNDWDTVFTLSGLTGTFAIAPSAGLFVSVAAVNADGVESLFSVEKLIALTATEEPADAADRIRLLPNRPNPFDEATWITFWIPEVPAYRQASILISDLQGRIIQELPVQLKQGLNETMYTHGYGVRGTFAYTLSIDGRVVDSRQMVFAN